MVEVSAARERVLEVSARLFRERGYRAVSMNDVAQALNMRKASLYYHVPQGKDQLFALVTVRTLADYAEGLRAAIDAAAPQLEAQLLAAADYILLQPPIDSTRLYRSDLPALPENLAQTIMMVANVALIEPILEVIAAAHMRGDIRDVDMKMIAATFIVAVESLHEQSRYRGADKDELARGIVALFMDGLRAPAV
jgi:AcrR family transcriptional regulator